MSARAPGLTACGVFALAAFGVAVIAPGVAVTAQQAPAPPDVRSRRVQGNVWLINAGFVNVAAQIGDDGVLVVDTATESLGEKILEEITRLAGGRTIRFIVNTHAHPDHAGGNVTIAKAGRSVIAGNFVGQAGPGAANLAKIWAHENTLRRLSEGEGSQSAAPSEAWPTDTYFTRRNDLFFNGEAVQMLHQPHAHTDGDTLVYFRKSDVIVAGDVYVNSTFPVFNMEQGGSYQGVIASLNRIIEITVPKDKQEGGTYVIPGHGRLADEADVVEYRDMATILRDRFRDAIRKKMTLDQVKAANLVRDYEGRYGASEGFWTTDAFVEAAYRSLSPAQPSAAPATKPAATAAEPAR